MKKLLLALSVFACSVQAATIGPPTCPASVTLPQAISISVPYASGGLATGLEGTLTLSQPVGPVTVTVAGTALAASKSVSTLNNVVVWVGLLNGVANRNAIADGQIATIIIQPLAATPAGSLTIGFSNTVAVDATGTVIATTPTSSCTVTLLGTSPPPFTITTLTIPNGVVGSPYPPTQLLASASATWSGTPCAPGVTLSSSGALGGTATAAVAGCTFTVTATNSTGTIATKAYSLTITAAPISACDVNKDGKIDASDVFAAVVDIQTAVAIFPGSTLVPMTQLQLVINSDVPGGVCSTSVIVPPPSPPPPSAVLTSLTATNPMLSAAGSPPPSLTATLSAGAPTGGASIVFAESSNGCDLVTTVLPSTVVIAAGATNGQLPISLKSGFARSCTFIATYLGVTKSATVTAGP